MEILFLPFCQPVYNVQEMKNKFSLARCVWEWRRYTR